MSVGPRSPKAFPAPTPDSAGIPHAIQDEVLIAPFRMGNHATALTGYPEEDPIMAENWKDAEYAKNDSVRYYVSFNHLIGAEEGQLRDRDAERLRVEDWRKTP